MPDRIILIKTKSVYGKDLHYPANTAAECFCRLVGSKTLTSWDLGIASELGFKIEFVL